MSASQQLVSAFQRFLTQCESYNGQPAVDPYSFDVYTDVAKAVHNATIRLHEEQPQQLVAAASLILEPYFLPTIQTTLETAAQRGRQPMSDQLDGDGPVMLALMHGTRSIALVHSCASLLYRLTDPFLSGQVHHSTRLGTGSNRVTAGALATDLCRALLAPRLLSSVSAMVRTWQDRIVDLARVSRGGPAPQRLAAMLGPASQHWAHFASEAWLLCGTALNDAAHAAELLLWAAHHSVRFSQDGAAAAAAAAVGVPGAGVPQPQSVPQPVEWAVAGLEESGLLGALAAAFMAVPPMPAAVAQQVSVQQNDGGDLPEWASQALLQLGLTRRHLSRAARQLSATLQQRLCRRMANPVDGYTESIPASPFAQRAVKVLTAPALLRLQRCLLRRTASEVAVKPLLSRDPNLRSLLRTYCEGSARAAGLPGGCAWGLLESRRLGAFVAASGTWSLSELGNAHVEISKETIQEELLFQSLHSPLVIWAILTEMKGCGAELAAAMRPIAASQDPDQDRSSLPELGLLKLFHTGMVATHAYVLAAGGARAATTRADAAGSILRPVAVGQGAAQLVRRVPDLEAARQCVPIAVGTVARALDVELWEADLRAEALGRNPGPDPHVNRNHAASVRDMLHMMLLTMQKLGDKINDIDVQPLGPPTISPSIPASLRAALAGELIHVRWYLVLEECARMTAPVALRGPSLAAFSAAFIPPRELLKYYQTAAAADADAAAAARSAADAAGGGGDGEAWTPQDDVAAAAAERAAWTAARAAATAGELSGLLVTLGKVAGSLAAAKYTAAMAPGAPADAMGMHLGEQADDPDFMIDAMCRAAVSAAEAVAAAAAAGQSVARGTVLSPADAAKLRGGIAAATAGACRALTARAPMSERQVQTLGGGIPNGVLAQLMARGAQFSVKLTGEGIPLFGAAAQLLQGCLVHWAAAGSPEARAALLSARLERFFAAAFRMFTTACARYNGDRGTVSGIELVTTAADAVVRALLALAAKDGACRGVSGTSPRVWLRRGELADAVQAAVRELRGAGGGRTAEALRRLKLAAADVEERVGDGPSGFAVQARTLLAELGPDQTAGSRTTDEMGRVPAGGALGLLQVVACSNPACDVLAGHCEAALKPKKCSACTAVRYCRTACQKSHWGEGHKEHCKALKAAREAAEAETAAAAAAAAAGEPSAE